MQEYPLISIVVPCFNGEKYLGEAIESALNQTYPNIEVIVVNDGSTDGSLKVAKSFLPKVRIFSQANKGESAARNKGIKWAKGEYLNFLDADDYFLKEKIWKCYEPIAKGYDVVFCEFESVFETPGWFNHRGAEKNQTWDSKEPVFHSLSASIASSAPLYHKKVFEKVGEFDERIQVQQDIDFFFRVALKGLQIKKLSERLIKIREHDSPFRVRNQSNHALKALEGQDIIFEKAKKHEVLTPKVKQLIADRYARYGRKAYQAALRTEGKDAFKKAKRLSYFPKPTVGFPVYNLLSLLLGLSLLEFFRFKLKRLNKR